MAFRSTRISVYKLLSVSSMRRLHGQKWNVMTSLNVLVSGDTLAFGYQFFL